MRRLRGSRAGEHLRPVRFFNVWIEAVDDLGQPARSLVSPADIELDEEDLELFADTDPAHVAEFWDEWELEGRRFQRLRPEQTGKVRCRYCRERRDVTEGGRLASHSPRRSKERCVGSGLLVRQDRRWVFEVKRWRDEEPQA